MTQKLIEQAKLVKLAIFDVDGVMTDGKLYYSDAGDECKAFHVRDGYGIKQLMSHDIVVAIVTARNSSIVSRRMQELGIKFVFQGVNDKKNVLNDLLNELNLVSAQVAYTGDDLIDVPIMQSVGLSFAVADAHPLVIDMAAITTKLPGGKGAVREVCDYILSAKEIAFL